ncbi:DUF2789 domain-containing protein [Spongiibacter sp. KMU-166]|uniref:DUF2789 domain-containing protein n=1 Tax=Spongiibacter thalassae TaxID=2721624 RepID=A0ABX1GFI2_9GAMM|nr:DUF2789 domain-containing protein [Spongiibacter thalassae]NKI17959.1 DUF2789 domain-containing protein [Spongiibacter thalassae]
MDIDSTHSMKSLFQQLGLEDSEEAIERFIVRHRPLPRDLLLHEASFWKPNQAAFLKESLDEDAEWAEIVDELDARMRH